MTYAVEMCSGDIPRTYQVPWRSVQAFKYRYNYYRNNLRGCNVCINYSKGSEKYAVEMTSCGMIYTPSFTKTGTSVQAIFRFGLRNLRGCNAGITDGWNL
jgi:hypothetical protein